jgi:hypothetical protein
VAGSGKVAGRKRRKRRGSRLILLWLALALLVAGFLARRMFEPGAIQMTRHSRPEYPALAPLMTPAPTAPAPPRMAESNPTPAAPGAQDSRHNYPPAHDSITDRERRELQDVLKRHSK